MSDAAWTNVRKELEGLTALLATPASAQRLYEFADRFVRLARAYNAAVLAEGKTSLRLKAALKALDLATKKSELERFVDPSN
jgi:hypothetical protein